MSSVPVFFCCQANMRIFAGYGSSKDISVYTSINLHPSQIFIVGRPSKKMQHQCQVRTQCGSISPIGPLFILVVQ